MEVKRRADKIEFKMDHELKLSTEKHLDYQHLTESITSSIPVL